MGVPGCMHSDLTSPCILIYSLACHYGVCRVRVRICKRVRSPGIDSKESIPPAFVAWRGRYDKWMVNTHLFLILRQYQALAKLCFQERFNASLCCTMLMKKACSTVFGRKNIHVAFKLMLPKHGSAN
jgi:hypothetical protein